MWLVLVYEELRHNIIPLVCVWMYVLGGSPVGVALLLNCKVYTLVRKANEKLFSELMMLNTVSEVRSSNSGGQFCVRDR